jgi:formiminotetrahydrofolate cyclodeaminase
MEELDDEDPQAKLEREIDELFERSDNAYFKIMQKIIEEIHGEEPREL